MNVFFQRGSANSKRLYHVDLANTVLRPLSPQVQAEIVADLRHGRYAGAAEALEALPRLWMWGGPGGVRTDIASVTPGDLCTFILDDEFKAVCRIYRRLHLDGDTSTRIAGRKWQLNTYPEIWALDYSWRVPDVWRREVGQQLTGNPLFFVRGRGALFPHHRRNIAGLPESWFDTRGGVAGLLRLLQMPTGEINRLLR